MVKELLSSTSSRSSSGRGEAGTPGMRETKKRKKAPSSTTGSVVAPPKVPKGDVYSEVIDFEEKEALRRSPEKDVSLFHDTCGEISKLMKDILELKLKKGEHSQADIMEKRIAASLHFVTLKKLNRLEKVRLKQARDTTNEAKQKVDNYHLTLQNLLYEVMHLQKEVTKCQEFKSKDEDIDLVPVQVFYKEAPEKISRLTVTQKDPHQLKLARLEWELDQRKDLAAKCKKLEESKESVAKAIREKQEYLDNLAPRLNSILEATKPLQEYLEMPLDKNRIQHTMAQYLPCVLYTLFVQCSAYQEACDKLLEVTVEGDLEEAKNFQHDLNEVGQLAGGGSGGEGEGEGEESDSEGEGDGEGGEGREEGRSGSRAKKRHRRKKSQLDRVQEKRKKLLTPHPLWIKFVVRVKDGKSMTVKFFYLVSLHIVTAKCDLNIEASLLRGDILSNESILSCLFPGDRGSDSPNAGNSFQLNRVGISSIKEHLSETGVPYLWAQRLGGLDFLQTDPTSCMDDKGEFKSRPAVPAIPDSTLSCSQVEGTVRAIRQRLQSRIALAKQMDAFEKAILPPPPSQLASMFPAKVLSKLTSWRSVTWEEFALNHLARNMALEVGVIHHDFFYRAVMERGNVKLVALIAIRPGYPSVAPIFSLQLLWEGEADKERDAHKHDSLREMEMEVNVYWNEFKSAKEQLLICQLHRLLACLDIYVESEGELGTVEKNEFPKEKIFFKAVRGRNRSRPFKFLSAGGGIFTQR